VKRTLATRLLAGYALTVVAVLALLAVVLDRTLERAFLEELTDSLEGQAHAVRAALPAEAGALQEQAAALGRELGIRVTVVRTDGVVVADSTGDPSGFENHAGRPEVRAALAGRVGVASRVSESVGRPFRYVALPPREGLVVRVALPLSIVEERLGEVRLLVGLGTALVAVVGIGAVWLVARGLTRPLRVMTSEVARMSEGDLSVRVPEGRTAELGLLAETLNRMAGDLGARIEQVRADGQRLEEILSAMEEGIVLVGAGQAIRYANPAVRRMLGTDPQSLRTLTPASLRPLVEDASESGRTSQREVETGLPVRTLLATAIPVAGGVLLVLRDVTAARRVEAMRRDFVADASHELKTPVAAIQAAAETLERTLRDDPEATARFAAQLRHEAGRLSRMVSDLLDLSRLESERPELGSVRLDQLAQEEAGRIGGHAREAGIELEVDIAPVTVAGSRKDLALLVGNLLENAVRYTPTGGRVRLDVGTIDGRAQMVVTDTGIGIPSRDLPRVFERFYRVDRARSRATGGTGLGLSIAKHVAEQHGGRIEAESELGRGSTFRVILPEGTARPRPGSAA
jgi:two-component system phosphate regulon sensor histidine kinase PhoR